jgi:hypothetical protein
MDCGGGARCAPPFFIAGVLFMAFHSADRYPAIDSQASSSEVSSNATSSITARLIESAQPQPIKTLGNKAHAATVRRLAERYGVQPGEQCDLLGPGWVIEVETAATVAVGIQKLLNETGRRFVAMTNRESIQDALALTKATEIGVMSPQGDIVKEAGMGSGAAVA